MEIDNQGAVLHCNSELMPDDVAGRHAFYNARYKITSFLDPHEIICMPFFGGGAQGEWLAGRLVSWLVCVYASLLVLACVFV